jgi:hypothetical protein
MRALRLTIAAAVLGLSACGGPRRPIEVNVKEFPGDVAIGKKPSAEPATTIPPAVNPEPIGFPSFLQPPAAFRTVGASITSDPPATTTPSTRRPCATADPFASPRLEAPKSPLAPPAPNALVYRNNGTFEVSQRGGPVVKGAYPELSTRRIESHRLANGTFEYVVKEPSGTSLTATTYRLDLAKGLYLLEVATTMADGSVDRFHATPSDALPLLTFPVVPGTQIGGIGLDPATATSMSIVGTVVGKARVDACGSWLDTWEVQVTEGRITGPNKQLHFTATYDIGTQYGALSVRDTVAYSCDEQINDYCDGGLKVVTKNTASVLVEPSIGQKT